MISIIIIITIYHALNRRNDGAGTNECSDDDSIVGDWLIYWLVYSLIDDDDNDSDDGDNDQ